MPNWEELKSDIEKRSQEFQTDLRTFEQETLAKIEAAKQDQIAATLDKIDGQLTKLEGRLDRIEDQLKDKDEEGDGNARIKPRT